MIVALDGPSAAGKGTLAHRLAAHFGFVHLDTGLLYRAVALRVLRSGGDPTDPRAATAAAREVAVEELDEPALKDEATGRVASQVSAIAQVRDVLIPLQRAFAARPPGCAKGAVLDGRDIGTVVCPEAEVKLYVTASLPTRARRRVRELKARGIAADERDVREEMYQRDERDRTRAVSPLRMADDAHLLDTTNLSIDSAFATAKAFVAARQG